MRKVLLMLMFILMTLMARAITATVYVKAENPLYLYSWYSANGITSQPLGVWPGTLMTETAVVKGESFWKMTIETSDDAVSFNIIFNDGNGHQTADILGLASDRYFTYDGNAGYQDVSEEYETVPNAEISQVEIQGDFSGLMQKGEGHVYTMELDLSQTSYDQQFRLIINGSVNGDIESKLKIDAPANWAEVQENGCVLRHSLTDYKTYLLTATWEENYDALSGWTLKIEGIQSKYEVIDTKEWQILAAYYQSANKEGSWTRPWDFAVETPSVKTLPGVTANDGHVIGIDLSNNNLSGTFPVALLALPMLENLNLSNNQLSGNLGMTMAAFVKMNPSAIIALKSVNIAANKFTGNVGLFAACCPNLTTLDASHNCLEDVYPMISPNVASLNLSHQTIGRVVELHLSNMTVEEMATKVPSILIYNHQNQTFVPNINVLCTTEDKSWGMAMSYQNGQMAATYVSGQNTYYGNSGDTFNVSVLKNDGTPEGSTFRIKLYFDEGDSNFDGQVNVLDLQTDINYIMEKYQKRPYNFTAANLWKDDLINIQDIICLVNLLMNTEDVGDEQSASARGRAMQMSDATVYVQNGQLMLNTTLPVAAFDITLSGADGINVAKDMERMGMTITKKVTHDGIRLIGYSMNGAYIPMGDTAIGTLSSNAACVRHAMLSDSEANNISVSVDANTTGIETVRMSSSESTEIYDLQGRKVNTMSHKGLYIMNGRKIIK